MMKNMTAVMKKYGWSRETFEGRRVELEMWPFSGIRFDRLPQDSADLLQAIATDYPEAVQIWCGKDGGWGTTVTPGAQLSPRDVHRIKPDWTVPDEPDEEEEWFWGEAVWQTRTSADLTALGYRIPTQGTDSRAISAANIPYMKIEGWRWVGFVYGEREPGEPSSLHPDAWMYVDDDVVYAGWSVWRKDGA
jgi:hypothetical protein